MSKACAILASSITFLDLTFPPLDISNISWSPSKSVKYPSESNPSGNNSGKASLNFVSPSKYAANAGVTSHPALAKDFTTPSTPAFVNPSCPNLLAILANS